MRVRLVNMLETSRAYRFLGQTGNLNIADGTFLFVADNGMFLSGKILEKEFSETHLIFRNENNVFTFELM